MRPDTQDQPVNLAERLAHSGLRNTQQREVIYRALHERRDHPTADEVYARVRPDLPSISLATVYNCLETLVQCDLVRQVNFEREPTRLSYATASTTTILLGRVSLSRILKINPLVLKPRL